jgi:hypothetical protein
MWLLIWLSGAQALLKVVGVTVVGLLLLLLLVLVLSVPPARQLGDGLSLGTIAQHLPLSLPQLPDALPQTQPFHEALRHRLPIAEPVAVARRLLLVRELVLFPQLRLARRRRAWRRRFQVQV